MTLQWPFQRPSSLLGLALEPSEVVVCRLRRRGETISVISSERIPIPANMFKTDPIGAGRELHARLQEAHVSPGRCIGCIPLSWAFSTELELPNISQSDIESMVRLEAERRFPLAPDDLVLALSRKYVHDEVQRALLVGVPADYLANVEKALRAARLRPVSLTIGLAALADEHPEARAALFSVGKGFVDLALLNNGRPPILRNLVWRHDSSASLDSSTIQEMARHLRVSLARLPAEWRELITTAIVYSGAGVSTEEQSLLAELLAELGMDMHEATLRGLPQTPQDSPAVLAATARALLGAAPALELIPPKRKAHTWSIAARFSARSARGAVALVATTILFLVGAFVFQARQLDGLENHWSAISPRVENARILQERVKKYRSWYDDVTIPSLAILKYVAAAFPDEGSVWIKSIRVKDRTAATCSGNATSRSEWMQVMEKLGGNKDLEDLQVVQARGDAPFSFTVTFRWKGKDAGGI